MRRPEVDLPRSFTIRESSHRIHNPFTPGKLATLGQALSPPPGTPMLDLACGTGEMLCTWARDHQVTGTGIDISTVFIAAARARAAELGVDGRVSFVHGDASGYLAAARRASPRASAPPGSAAAYPARSSSCGTACSPAA
jgi:SAM-dependent methyltransferase